MQIAIEIGQREIGCLKTNQCIVAEVSALAEQPYVCGLASDHRPDPVIILECDVEV